MTGERRSVQERKPSTLDNSFISSTRTVMVTQTQNTNLMKRCVVWCIKDSQISILYGGKSIKKCQNWKYGEVAKKHAI